MKRLAVLMLGLLTGCGYYFGGGGSCPEPPDLTPSGAYLGAEGATVEVSGDVVTITADDGTSQRYRLTNPALYADYVVACGPRPATQRLRTIELGSAASATGGVLQVRTTGDVTFEENRTTVSHGTARHLDGGKRLTVTFDRLPDQTTFSANWTFDTAEGQVDEAVSFTISAGPGFAHILGAECL